MAISRAALLIDGGHGEGAGALIRTALALSTITQQPFRLIHARGATKRPGLNSEDLAVGYALMGACGAKVDGFEPGSHEFSFTPTKPVEGVSGEMVAPNGEDGSHSAGALVILSSVAPILSRTGVYCRLVAKGETHGQRLLSYEYFANVTVPAWKKMGLYSFPELKLAGFGRASIGEVGLEVEPSVFNGMEWTTRGRLLSIRAIITTAELAETVGQRGVAHFSRLAYYAGIPVDAEVVHAPSTGPGAFVTVLAEYENGIGGATEMGTKGVRIESVVQTAFESLMEWMRSDATVDAFLADQLLVPAVLAEGTTSFTTPLLTERLATMVWVVKQFLPIHITIRGQVGGPASVSIQR